MSLETPQKIALLQAKQEFRLTVISFLLHSIHNPQAVEKILARPKGDSKDQRIADLLKKRAKNA